MQRRSLGKAEHRTDRKTPRIENARFFSHHWIWILFGLGLENWLLRRQAGGRGFTRTKVAGLAPNRLAPRSSRRRRSNRLLDLSEPLLAPEHLLADEERRQAEHAPLHCFGSIVGELLFDRVALRGGKQARPVQPQRRW